MSERRVRRAPHSASSEPALSARQIAALVIFGLIILLGPLLFGAVDRLPQIVLLVLFGLGILVQPPAVLPLSRWGNRLAIAFVGLLLFKEFASSAWFGATTWRATLVKDYGLELPFTHHPEPTRALDALLAAAVGVVWFIWVRRLAADRAQRAAMAWTFVGTAALVAIVAFATRQPGAQAIYGLRYSPGWRGFGPFPNRNHSADYFAMASLVGSGCVAWAAARKRWGWFAVALGLVGLLFVAMLTTESRGGLVAFGVGLCVYFALCAAHGPGKRTLGAIAGAVILVAFLATLFGGQIFARFQSHEAGEVSTQTRVEIWHDTLGMWRDAPLFGHGVGAFASVFPLYQKLQLENQIVIHPESSWLQWLAELGAIPVLLAVVAVVFFVASQWRSMFERHRTFFLHAAALSAVAGFIVHACIDVPAHRWGTAGFALAALAFAFPLHLEGRRAPEPRKAAILPLFVAVFWWLPLNFDWPAWSPLSLLRLQAMEAQLASAVSLVSLQNALRWFPLNADLHQSVGRRLLRLGGRQNAAEWSKHFALANRLQPAVWEFPQIQARACLAVAPSQALIYWQQAIERGGIHREEILRTAVQETARFPALQAEWGRFAEAHPDLLLGFARSLPENMAGYYFRRWWKLRGDSPSYEPDEIADFYVMAFKWLHADEFISWTRAHSAIGVRDYLAWARLLHAWGEDEEAWKLLALKTPEPAFPKARPGVSREYLEATWRNTPGNVVNAQQLAQSLALAGEQNASDEIICTVGDSSKAPPWFVQKAAWTYRRHGRVADAVELLLQAR